MNYFFINKMHIKSYIPRYKTLCVFLYRFFQGKEIGFISNFFSFFFKFINLKTLFRKLKIKKVTRRKYSESKKKEVRLKFWKFVDFFLSQFYK